jgi:hypothetical protein
LIKLKVMKSLSLALLIFLISYCAYAQVTNTFPTSGNVGIGTTTPGAWFSNEVLQFAGVRPTIRLSPNYEGGLGTILFKGSYSNAGGAPDEFHLNYISSLTNPGILLSSYLNGPTDLIAFMGNGNVGIGTVTPREKLDIGGKTIIQNTLQTNDYTFIGQHQGQLRILNGLGIYGSKAFEFALMDNGTGVIQSNEAGIGYSNIALNPVSGDVGIGTMDPKGYKLAVNGKIRAHEIKVEIANWPDYVFTKDYKLPPLDETEKHIKEKGHLPGIPSAEEVKANGIDLGEMNAKLLQKIEELTLHLITQSKIFESKLEAQQKEINKLKNKKKI